MSAGARKHWRRARVGATVLAIVAATALAACGGDKEDPRRELTPDEQNALLRDIRKDNRRLQDLTPAERQYLIKKMGK